jgi:predicted TIM-barrel fold metal-dependent hydrolase
MVYGLGPFDPARFTAQPWRRVVPDMDNLLISVDDHVGEPKDLWTSRLPAKFIEAGPQLVQLGRGVDAWTFEEHVEPIVGLSGVAGREKEAMGREGTYADMRAGCFDPVARLEDLDADGVLASLCFPNFAGFSGSKFQMAKDKELALACIKAYNDFMLDEWCAAAPGRYIPITIVPLFDPAAAVKEIERCAAKGARALAFSENPYHQGFPSIHDTSGYWEPVWSAVQDAQLVLCMHIGSSSFLPAYKVPDSPWTAKFATVFINGQFAMIDWLLSGLFDKYPGLKVSFSEAGIGWMPYVLEHVDRTWLKHAEWSKSPVKDLPSSYFADHVFGCFIDDPVGARMATELGIDNILVETDYPHADTIWPNSQKVLMGQLTHLSDEDREKVLRTNAERLFRFKPSGIGQR